jgi:hypothetical protein
MEDKKVKRASNPVDTDGRWEDFFEAALLDNIEDDREQAEADNRLAASTGTNIDSDDDDDDFDNNDDSDSDNGNSD